MSSSLPIWETMSTRNASAMIWVGDAIYGDDFEVVAHPPPPPHTPTTVSSSTTSSINTINWNQFVSSWFSFQGKRILRPATPTILQELFHQLITNPGYRRFTRRDVATMTTADNHPPMTVLGVWDDHDYGINNGDFRYMYRTESAKLYLQFLQRSAGTHHPLDLHYLEQRASAGKGLYGVKVLDFHRPMGYELMSDDDAGIEWNDGDATSAYPLPPRPLSDRSVAIFLLDCRSNKTPWSHPRQQFKSSHRPYYDSDYYSTLNYEADFLGTEQWQWFERSLRRSTASVNIIVQGLQVHADHLYVIFRISF